MSFEPELLQEPKLDLTGVTVEHEQYLARFDHVLTSLGIHSAELARRLGVTAQAVHSWRIRGAIGAETRYSFEQNTGFDFDWVNKGIGREQARHAQPETHIIFQRITVNAVIQTSLDQLGYDLVSYYDDNGKLLFTSRQQDDLPY